ncbi:putative ribonuclease H-like domain-containing protein [Tanacetum coccineum]
MHMTGNMSYLIDYGEIDGGYVAFGGNPKGGKITEKGIIKTGNLDFENVYFVRELKFNLFSVSQICDKKNSVLFNDTGCIILSPNFKLTDESHVLLKVPKKNNMYSVHLKNIVPKGGLTCLFEKATSDESKLWHRRLGHINFKTMNKLVKGNLVRGLPSKLFEIHQTCVACQKGKQHRASCTKACDDAGKARMEIVPGKDYILLPLWTADLPFSQSSKSSPDVGFKTLGDNEKKEDNINSTTNVNTASTNEVNDVGTKTSIELPNDLNMPELEDIVYSNDDEDVGAEADMNNLDAFITDELLQFKLQKVWTLVELPNGKRAIGTKWVFRNKKDEKEIVIQKVFAPVARIEAIRLFLAYASFKDFMIYQMDGKNVFLYGKIKKEVYVCQPPGFEDPNFPDRVYKVEKALYVLHQAPRVWYETLSTYLLDNGFQRGKIDKTLFIKRDKGDILLVQKKDGTFISQDKYVTKILKKFGFTDINTASTHMETQKLLLKNEDGKEVDVHVYRSMIGSLVYLTSLRPDIMFAVCACARYQVNQKILHLHAVKRIFRYLKGQLKLGLWYPKDSPFDLVAYTDSDYAGASLDRKSTIGGCQFLGSRLISWQCKKQTVVANSITEAEYVIASSCYRQLLWIQNQLFDYSEGFEQIVDFLNAHTIKYALTVNPTIYTSYIEKFWATIKGKTVNRKVQLQALVDGKKIIVTEASIRSDLQLNDEECMDCLPNATIFKELTRMGMVKNLDNAGKFLMYPRFVQVFLDKHLEGMSSHKRIYVTPSHTKKIFRNMERVGKGFSRRETPLFPIMVVQNQADMGEGSAIHTDPHHTPTIIQPSISQPQRKQRPRKPKRKDTEIPQPSGPTTNVADEAVYKERDNNLERVATTAIGLDVEQDRGNINKTQSKATPNEPSSPGTSSCVGPRRQETIGDTIAQTRSENVSKFSNDPLLVRETTLVNKTQGRYGDDIMFDVSDLAGEEVFVAKQGVSDKDVNLSVNEVTLAQALAALKSAKVQEKANVVGKPRESIITTPTLTTTTVATIITATSTRPKAKGLVIHEEEQATTPTICSQQPLQAKIQDNGKAKMIEPEPVKKLSKKINSSFMRKWLKGYKLNLMNKKGLEKKEALCSKKNRREKEQTTKKAQQRSIMCPYLKNMEGWKPKDLKSKSFANIQELFDKAMKRVNTFIDYRTELVEGSSENAEAEIAQESSSKRVGDELEQESINKQKVDEDKETTRLKILMEVIPDEEEVAVDAIPLTTKSPSIEKLMLAEAQEAGQILDEEKLAFIADPRIEEAPVAQQTIPQNLAFQTKDLDAYDSDCDDISSAKVVLMANLSNCDPDVLFEDTNSSAPNDLLVLSLVEQMTDHVANLDKENQTNKMINESLIAELERYKERVTIFKQRLNVDLNKRKKLIDFQMDDLIRNRNAKLAAFQQEIDTLKETLSKKRNP